MICKLYYHIGEFIKSFFSSLILVVIIILNIFFSSFVYSSWYPVVVENDLVMSCLKILLGILLFTSLIYSMKKFDDKKLFILIIIINLFGFISKFTLIYSIKNLPVNDSWFMLDSLNQIFSDKLFTFLPGGYLSMHKHQLGLATILTPVVKLFGNNSQSIFTLQVILVQLSVLFLSIGTFISKGVRNAYFTTVLLNIFLPNLFSVFLFYGDIYSLFFLSIVYILYMLSKRSQNCYINLFIYFVIYLLLSFSYLSRVTTGVFIIAYILLLLIDKNSKLTNVFKIIVLLSIFVIPSTINEYYYKTNYNLELTKNSLPNNTWLRIGTSYSSWDDKSAGFYDIQINYDFAETKYDYYEMKKINSIEIEKQLEHLFLNKEIFNFLQNKMIITWADADFEMATLILPFSGKRFGEIIINSSDDYYGAGSLSLKPTNIIGLTLIEQYFNVRNIEKIFIYGMLFWTLVLFILCNKNREIRFLQIALIGMFIYLMIFEVKSRYLWVFINLWIVSISYDTESNVRILVNRIKGNNDTK